MRSACKVRVSAVFVLLLALLVSACGAAISGTHDDPSISTRVKIALLNDPAVAPYRIDAKTAAGIVTLSGTVKTQEEADRAVAVARKAVGVKDVKSELKISSQSPVASRQ